MNQEIEQNELIHQYLTGQMDPVKKEEFIKMLSSDPTLKYRMEKFQKAAELINEGALRNIRNELTSIHKHQIKTNILKKWGNGLVISGIIILTSVYIYNNYRKTDKPKNVISRSEFYDSLKNEANSAVKTNKTNPKSEINSLNKEPLTDTTNNKYPYKYNTDTSQKKPDLIKSIVEPTNHEKDVPYNNVQNTDLKKPDIAHTDEGASNKINCKKVKIKASITSNESCNNQPTGKIYIDPNSLNGGTPPYRFSLDNTTFTDSLSFSGLYPRNYRIYVRDASNCNVLLGSIWIESINCDYHKAFAPLKGELWDAPLNVYDDGTITIYTKTGTIIYSLNFHAGETVLWNGETNNGKQLPMGLYLFKINYSDGTKFNGSVTIIK